MNGDSLHVIQGNLPLSDVLKYIHDVLQGVACVTDLPAYQCYTDTEYELL